MADNINPTASTSTAANFLPNFYRTDANKKFLQSTIEQLTQPGTVRKINGYIGRKHAKPTIGSDIFIAAADSTRQHYQLEPGMVVTDMLGNTTFFKDYIDYINQLSVFGSDVSNHARLNKQEFYSWDPHIDFDKFVNFQNYYWLPYGPAAIQVYGQFEKIVSTFTVEVESEGNNNAYVITPDGLTRDPTITLYRGHTYKFDINSPGNPFSIKQFRSSGTSDRYKSDGIDNYAVETGIITFTVPHNAPSVLYYQSERDADLGGVIHVKELSENSGINVAMDILGKKSYILSDGTPLSNGMKVSFGGVVTPNEYAIGNFYVEGVGTAIKLVNALSLDIETSFTVSNAVLFDATQFDSVPFSEATSYAGISDYIVMNRACRDNNPWARMNRWFHINVIETTAKLNGTVVDVDQTSRATRAIIEFEADMRLYNYGTSTVPDVDVIDTYTTDVFSDIEGASGYNVDGINLIDGMRIIFTADIDIKVKNKIFKVTTSDFRHLSVNNEGYTTQLHLEEINTPQAGQVVLIHRGTINKGSAYWYNGTTAAWEIAQRKSSINQPPLFDVVDNDGVSFGDTTMYHGTTFAGTSLFSYKVGTGKVDPALGFPLTYKNINNIGDIVFNFNLISDIFRFKRGESVVDQTIDIGFIPTLDYTGAVTYVNGWRKNSLENTQAAIRIYKLSNKTNNFELDIFDNINELSDLILKIYINGIRLSASAWHLEMGPTYKHIILNNDIMTPDILTIRAFTAQSVNATGYYEIPLNLQNNPLNAALSDFTLGEVIDHVTSIIDNAPGFVGNFPGVNNLRDLGQVAQYGTKFLQHSGPASLSLYHITNESNNVIRSIEKSRDDYGKFKRSFMTMAETLGIDTAPAAHVDLILRAMNKSKPNTFPYYFSDMVAYGSNTNTIITVIDHRILLYPLTDIFNLSSLSNRAVIVYLNDTQLLYGRDYDFDSNGFISISATKVNGDEITICEYENTDGCFVPETPSKLGIWPKYEPMMYVDTSLVTPMTMIQGHDGSLVLSYGDYRDALVLELESRIYNNIKVTYDTTIFDIDSIIPGYNTQGEYTQQEFNSVLAPSFYQWTTLIDQDFSKPLHYDKNNSFTYNYINQSAPDGRPVPGYWRGVYSWLLGTDRPHLCPWEMLGFRIEPTWWQSVYGPAPYTCDNLVLWNDISHGMVKAPDIPVTILPRYIKPFLMSHIPVDESGNLLSPLVAGLVNGVVTNAVTDNFVFGDISPIEATWRRSSYYPFSVLITAMLLSPANTFGVLLDRSRIIRNLTGQLIYKDTGLRVTPASIKLPNISNSILRVQTAGIINYVINYILSDNLLSLTNYSTDLLNISAKLSYRVGAFTSKDKFNLILDSRTPMSSGTVFVPQENYNIILNSSSPIRKITYSGVIITKLASGFSVKGYSYIDPYFKYYGWIQSGATINVGGISESFTAWTPMHQYVAGKVVQYNKLYYRVVTQHTSTSEFVSNYFAILTGVPISGGKNAILRKLWDRTSPTTIPYDTTFSTVQAVVDFLLGYGEYLKDQGFVFDEFNNNMAQVTNWETSAKEFLFWTTQNWSSGQDKWQEWRQDTVTSYDTIVRYEGDYYTTIRTSPASPIFIEEDFVKLDGLSTVGSSVISVSPAASKITFKTQLCVVDDITNAFNGYSIVRVDGRPIDRAFINSYREDNGVSYTPQGNDGIYGASFYLIQNEQVVILDNTTIFNDTMYNPVSGYKQDRIKVSGYISANWNGSFDVPGFIFDNAVITNWEPWNAYALGDIVVYLQFYYSAIAVTPGSEKFDFSKWYKLPAKPVPALLPNLNYKATQFEDFYSLNSDNFDSSQQKFAQHLIGYQKRQYLENIIQDDVSEFNFYQGMIKDKGTQNVLNKLFDVLSADGEESLTFYEEWAVRVGQYGASAAFENIEFIIDASLVRSNPQGFELVKVIEPVSRDFVIRQSPSDIYLPPDGYNSSPWPLLKNRTSFLRSAGYVRGSDVLYSIKSLSNLSDIDSTGSNLYPISTFDNGDYVWCSFDSHGWNVYRFTHYDIIVDNLEYKNNILTISINLLVTYEVGTYIGIRQFCDANDVIANLDGFYEILSVERTQITISVPGITIPSPFISNGGILIYVMTQQRVNSIDNIDTMIPYPLKHNELVWTDDRDGSGNWATWRYAPVYTREVLYNDDILAGIEYGRSVAIDVSGTVLVVATTSGTLSVYDRGSSISNFIKRQVINPPFINLHLDNNKENIAEAISISPDRRWLATGSPNIGNAAFSNNTSQSYDTDLITISEEAISSDIANHGIITIYELDVNNISSLVATILSPHPTAEERFGASVVFGIDCLYVGAMAGFGKIYKLVYATTIRATATYIPAGSLVTSYPITGETVADSYIISNISNIMSVHVGSSISGNGIISGSMVLSITIDTQSIMISNPATISVTSNTLTVEVRNLMTGSLAYPVIKVTNTTHINAGQVLRGIGFSNSPVVISVIDGTTILIDALPASTPFGEIQFTTTQWEYDSAVELVGEQLASGYGSSMVISEDKSTLVVSAPGNEYLGGIVYVYRNDQLLTQLASGNPFYGAGVAVSSTGHYIALSGTITQPTSNSGCVSVYTETIINNTVFYIRDREITLNNPENFESFGSKLWFMNGDNSLAVFSENASTQEIWVFNDYTTFDNATTDFILVNSLNSGRIDMYDRYSSYWVFSESLETTNSNTDGYGTSIAAASNILVVSSPYAIESNIKTGLLQYYVKADGAYSWTVIDHAIQPADATKIRKAFLYNRVTNKLITYLDVLDPIYGKIPGTADEELTYKTYYDPAIYSVGDMTVNVDDGAAWKTIQVGSLWWDLRSAKFTSNDSNDIVYRNSTWNTLAVGASIDIYEWVQSKYLPEAWDSQADTEAGLALGISGISLYGNKSYSIKSKYDNISQTLKKTYYFWVKNKVIVPATTGRYISSKDVAALISNPRGGGYQYLSLTSGNSFALANVSALLKDTDVVLSVDYWTIDSTDQNIHSHWKIISNDSPGVPLEIEQKWVDSLCGKDVGGRLVPDIALPLKYRYGVESRPRQGMFINRFEALKQYIEYVNKLLSENLISDTRDMAPFLAYDKEPSIIKGLYDVVIDTDAELSFANAGLFRRPTITPEIVNGKVVGINIITPGRGYLTAPYLEVVGSGIDAVIRSTINAVGQIIGCTIMNSGMGYDDNTSISIRDYSVLVHSDYYSSGGWSIYSYEPTASVWSRTHTQSYDVRKYWQYTDWYAVGYNQFSAIITAVDTYYELNTIVINIGELVKVRNTNNGTWVILKKYSSINSIDWTQSYTIVGNQNGTIQLSSSLYNAEKTSTGYDNMLYDSGRFDTSATTELRIMLTAIKTNILIDELAHEYMNLFFNTVRYVLFEQPFVDWIFKTSFVKARHNVGKLRQLVTYKNDNLVNFEEYVAEVKPYRTKIRQYVSDYTTLDNTSTAITDFDLPPIIDNGIIGSIDVKVTNETLLIDNSTIQTYPWKNWLDNVSFTIKSVVLADTGSGYAIPPVVRFVSASGTGASATAFISNGKVIGITLLTPGSGYLTAPTVHLDGGVQLNGKLARAVAIIGNDKVRSTLIKIKFDRISQTYFITELQDVASFIGGKYRVQFPLKWAPDIRIGTSTVTVDGTPELRDNYTLGVVKSTTLGYTSYSGNIVFDNAPALGATIEVTYLKDWGILNAADRINYYYNPQTGDLGKDLSQLMTGIDYGGVIVDGLGFEVSRGWDSMPFYSDKWDQSDATFSDYIIYVHAGDHDFTLPYVPADGVEINVYQNNIRIDDPNYGTVDQVNEQALMTTWVSTGNSREISLPGNVVVNENDLFVFRQSTSDGSILPQNSDYDTAISGGNLAYSTATGIAADDIIIDGDGFVTTTSSSAPEEVVPGQVADAVAIKVYDRPTSGSASINIDNYVADGIVVKFKITHFINSKNAVLVQVNTDGISVMQINNVDYVVDYKHSYVIFNSAPRVDSIISIFEIGRNGNNILDINHLVADGVTTEFATIAPWIASLTSAVYVNGIAAVCELQQTADTASIKFVVAPLLGDVIDYIIVDNAGKSFSVTTMERIVTDSRPATDSYELSYPIGNRLPNEAYVIVRVDNRVLSGGNNSYFTIQSNNLTYYIDAIKFTPYSIGIEAVVIYADGVMLTVGADYLVDLSGISVTLTQIAYGKYEGKQLIISIIEHQEYALIPATGSSRARIVFTSSYTSLQYVEIISSYNNEALDIQRTGVTVTPLFHLAPDTPAYYYYNNLLGGVLQLDRQVIDNNYVWVIKNGLLLVPSIDYKLNTDRISITFATESVSSDNYAVITFGSNLIVPGIAYMQFKDMLNRIIFKRLNSNKQTTLAADLHWNDTTITVVDSTNFDKPNTGKNRPGIIEIRGERIEFFEMTGNVLSRLHRGTLGTGAPSVHLAGVYVQEIGYSETIPYIETTITKHVVSDGSMVVALPNLVPTKSGEKWTYSPGFVTSIPSQYGQTDDIEVFVGGYNIQVNWAPNVSYAIGDIVIVGSYTYRCTTSHVSGALFASVNWDFFIGNIRLKNKPYKVHNVSVNADSPAGDIQFDADFAVDGISNSIRLTNKLDVGTQITIIKRVGTSWDQIASIQVGNSKIAEFLRAAPGSWYTGMQ